MGAKPRIVAAAQGVLLTSVALWSLGYAWSLLSLSVAARLTVLPSLILGAGLRCALIDGAARGRRTARLALAIFVALWFVFSLPAAIQNALDGQPSGGMKVALLVLVAVTSIAGVALLFTEGARAWYPAAPGYLGGRPLGGRAGEWFLNDGSATHGPVSEDDLRQMLRRGDIDDGVVVWTAGMPSWQEASIALGEKASREQQAF